MIGVAKIKLPPAIWTPAQIVTEGWYDASDAVTVIQADAAGRVSQWSDKSGFGRHMLQTTAALQLSTEIRQIGALNVLDGDGTQWIGDISFPLDADGNVSIFAVCVVDSVDNVSDSVYAMDGSGTDFKFSAGEVGDVSGDFNGFVQGAFAGGVKLVLTGGPFPGPSIYNTEFDKTGSGLAVARIDGTDRGSVNYTVNLVTSMNFTILADKAAVQILDGAVGEVIVVHDDLSQATRQKIEGYLAWRWGLVSNLPAGHPYESSPPFVS